MSRLVLLTVLAIAVWYYFPETRAIMLDAAEPLVSPIIRWGIEVCDTRGNCRTDPLVYPHDAYQFRVGILPSRPEIESVTPEEGPASGGTRVEISGSDFRAGARVFFDGNIQLLGLNNIPPTNSFIVR